MSIVYAVIARVDGDNVVNLCDYDLAKGNYPSIVLEILKNAKITESITYKYEDKFNFHILKDGNLMCVCMAKSVMKIKTAFAFLEEIRKQFKSKYPMEEINSAQAYQMSFGFADNFNTQITFFNSTQNQDKKDILMKELSQLQEVMSDNIDKLMLNEEKVELIVKQTRKHDSIADEYRKNASKMKKEAFWNKNKCKIAVVSVILLAVVAAIIII